MNAAMFHPSARMELDESALFYESRLRGLGARFGASVEEAVQRITDRPAAGTPLGGDYRESSQAFHSVSSIVSGKIMILTMGYSVRGRLLAVCPTERRGAVRLITARKATAHERRRHEG